MCRSVWCGTCYVPLENVPFHINKLVDGSGFEQVDAKDVNRLTIGRDGDHLTCSFQCDNCLFFMLKGRTAVLHNAKDKFLMVCLRRANLDAFWP